MSLTASPLNSTHCGSVTMPSGKPGTFAQLNVNGTLMPSNAPRGRYRVRGVEIYWTGRVAIGAARLPIASVSLEVRQ